MVDGAAHIRPVLFLWIVFALFFNCAKNSEIEILAKVGNVTITKAQFEKSYGEWMLFSREFDSKDMRRKYLKTMTDDLVLSNLLKDSLDTLLSKLIQEKAITQAAISLHDFDDLEISDDECRKLFQTKNSKQVFITESDFQMSLPSIRQELRTQKIQENRHHWVEKIMSQSDVKINRNLIKKNEIVLLNAMAIRRGDFGMVEKENSEINFNQNTIQIGETNWNIGDLLENIRFAPIAYSKENVEHCLAMLIRDEVVFQYGISENIHKLSNVQEQIEWQQQKAKSELYKISVADTIFETIKNAKNETMTRIQFQKQVENRLKMIIKNQKRNTEPIYYFERLEQCFES